MAKFKIGERVRIVAVSSDHFGKTGIVDSFQASYESHPFEGNCKEFEGLHAYAVTVDAIKITFVTAADLERAHR